MRHYFKPGLILLIVAALGFVVYRAAIVPVPGKTDVKKEALNKKYRKGPFDLRAIGKETKELNDKLAKLPPYVTPTSTTFSEPDLKRYIAVMTFTLDVVHKLQKKEPGKKRTIGEGLYWYSAYSKFINHALAKAQNEAGMTYDEFNWLGLQIKRAAMLVLNRKMKEFEPKLNRMLADRQEGEEVDDLKAQVKKIKFLQDHFSYHIDLVDRSTGTDIILPYSLDESIVPKENVRLFLKYKDQIRWTAGENFDGLDLTLDDF